MKIDKLAYLGLSILDISKRAIYEYYHNCIKAKYGGKLKLYYKDTDSCIVYMKLESVYADLTGNVEKRFDTSNYEDGRLLPMSKNKKDLGFIKDELGGKIMKEIVALRPKMYSYLMNNGNVKSTKKMCTQTTNKISRLQKVPRE